MHILGNPGATSRDDAIFSSERYFRRKFTLSAEEPLGTYSYRASFRSGRIPFRRLGRKIFFCPIREELWQGNSDAFLHQAVFFIYCRTFLFGPYNVTARLSWRALEKNIQRSSFLHLLPDLLVWPVQRNWKVVVESFKKKYSTKPRKSQALIWGLGTNTLPSIFSTDLSKVYRKQ